MKNSHLDGMAHLSPTVCSMQRSVWLVAALAMQMALATGFTNVASAKEAADSESVEATAVDLASFDNVWQTIQETHWDLDEAKWKRAKETFRGKAELAKTRGEVREVISELIGSLEQSHFGLIPSEAYDVLKETEKSGDEDDAKDDDSDSDKDGEVGLDVRLRDGLLTVVRVEENSSASKAGVKPGWTVTKLGKRTDVELIDAAKVATEHGPMRIDTLVGYMCERAMHGRVGERLKIELTDAAGQLQTPELHFEKHKGKTVGFGHFPKIRVRHSTKHLKESDIIYFTFNVFFDPPGVMKAFRDAIELARDKKGLIVDVRGNLGGIGGMTFGMASAFVDEPGQLGVMKMKDQELKFPLFPPLEPFTGPVAVLVDECSASSAEIFSGGLSDLKLARLFGKQTAGLALPSNITKLPNGDAFQYAFATYTSASGKVLEGVGVTPDEVIVPTKEQLNQTADPVLNRAVEWILEK